MLCSISFCMCFRDVVLVNVGIFCAYLIHCVSSDVGKRKKISSVFFKWTPLIVLSMYSVLVIGDLIQSCWDMRGMFNDPPYLASMYFVMPVYILSSLSLALRALMSCSPMHMMYAFLMRMTLYQTNIGGVV